MAQSAMLVSVADRSWGVLQSWNGLGPTLGNGDVEVGHVGSFLGGVFFECVRLRPTASVPIGDAVRDAVADALGSGFS